MPIKLSGNDFGEYYYSPDCGIPYERRTEPWLTNRLRKNRSFSKPNLFYLFGYMNDIYQ
jgi:hypothetical protein